MQKQSPSLILAVHTALSGIEIATSKNGEMEGYVVESATAQHSEKLIPLLEALLKKHQLTYQDFSHFAVSIGPGSFTGIRAGIAALQGISIVTQTPIIGITTLEWIAYQSGYSEVLVLQDAAREALYAQKFSISTDTIPKSLGEATLVSYEEAELLAKNVLHSLICDSAKENLGMIFSPTLLKPEMKHFVKLATLYAKLQPKALPAALPLYIRPPDAKKQKIS